MLSDEQLLKVHRVGSIAAGRVFFSEDERLVAGLRAVEAAVTADHRSEWNDRYNLLSSGYRKLQDELAAAQAVIAEVQASVLSGLSDCEPDYGDYEVSGRWVFDTLSRSPTDALQAHDRQVVAKALTDAADEIEVQHAEIGVTVESILAGLRAVSLVPGNPEPTEGEKR